MQDWREKPEVISDNQIKETVDADIVVIGAGHAGTSATGNCSGCRFGFQYTTSVPGQSISIAQTLGREVGAYLAKQGGKRS